MTLCTTCDYGVARVRGECMTCFMWRKNHNGEQRPDEVIVKHGQREFDRSLAASAS